MMDSPVVKENEQIFRKFCPNFNGFSGGIGYMDEQIKTFFDNFEVRHYRHDLLFNKPKFIGRNLSASYSLKEGDVGYVRYIEELNHLFDTYAVEGILVVPNETIAYIGQIVE